LPSTRALSVARQLIQSGASLGRLLPREIEHASKPLFVVAREDLPLEALLRHAQVADEIFGLPKQL
jgi:hypothetical protein